MEDFKALGDFILCDIIEIKNGSIGDILLTGTIPDTIDYKIISVGEEVPSEVGNLVGKHIVIDEYVGRRIKIKDKELLSVRYHDIIAIY